MQKVNKKEKEIAIRFYENAKFGDTYAKGKRHSAVFNAAADLHHPNAKYLLDFYSFEHWQHTARTDDDMGILEIVSENVNDDVLVSWVVRQDPITKSKQRVTGFCTLDMKIKACTLLIHDEDGGVVEIWKLPTKQCKRVVGKNSPTLLATNADLGVW